MILPNLKGKVALSDNELILACAAVLHEHVRSLPSDMPRRARLEPMGATAQAFRRFGAAERERAETISTPRPRSTRTDSPHVVQALRPRRTRRLNRPCVLGLLGTAERARAETIFNAEGTEHTDRFSTCRAGSAPSADSAFELSLRPRLARRPGTRARADHFNAEGAAHAERFSTCRAGSAPSADSAFKLSLRPRLPRRPGTKGRGDHFNAEGAEHADRFSTCRAGSAPSARSA
jgi:hypothetical protein